MAKRKQVHVPQAGSAGSSEECNPCPMAAPPSPPSGFPAIPQSLLDDPPLKSVLLLTCMDLRLMDNIVHFMDRMNLQNRYDHLTLAGSSMGANRLHANVPANGGSIDLPWSAVFFQHLVTAIEGLGREIGDIFLLEHLDCGAYKALHPCPDAACAYKTDTTFRRSVQTAMHAYEACAFEAEVRKFCDMRAAELQPTTTVIGKPTSPGCQSPSECEPRQHTPAEWKKIRSLYKKARIHRLVMDLVGNVFDLPRPSCEWATCQQLPKPHLCPQCSAGRAVVTTPPACG